MYIIIEKRVLSLLMRIYLNTLKCSLVITVYNLLDEIRITYQLH